jgi:hypothetical protein
MKSPLKRGNSSADVPEVQNSHGRAYGEEGKQCGEYLLGVRTVSQMSADGGNGVT